MDLYIDRDELGRSLARIQGVVERRSTNQVLSHVLLHVADGRLRATATDTEVAFIGDSDATVQSGGEIAVDAVSLFQIVRTLPDPVVRLQVTGRQRLEITSGRASFRLPGVAAEEYPPLPAFEVQGSIEIAETALRDLVERVQFAVSTDDARYGLNGAHLEARESADGTPVLRVVATDGHRLSSSEAAFEGHLSLTPRMLVPRKALSVLRKLLEGDGRVKLEFGEGAIRLVRPGQAFWFRLLDGEFPDYASVVPREGKHRITVRRSEILDTLRRVSVLVQERARPVRFAFRPNEVQVAVSHVDRGEIDERLPAELEGEPVDVGFNSRYLQDALGVLRGNDVLLEVGHALGPCRISDPDDPSAFFIVMPMRLD
jgi:DNA polymerase-3 subunit beta